MERSVLPAVRRHFNAERRHWRHRGQIEARRAFSVTDGWKIKRAQCARFIFDIALQRSCLHCNFSATKRAFSRRSAPSCKKFSLEKIRKKHQNHTVLMLFGGDKRDRTADLLTASQALSRTIGYAPPDGLGKGLNIPLRQLMRDKLQYSMEGICCQLAISNFDMYPSP